MNNDRGLGIWNQSSPILEALNLHDNKECNVLVDSTAPALMTNSTIGGGSAGDILLCNNSELTLLNTTFVQGAEVTGTAQLKVQWYATFEVLDRANKIIEGAPVDGFGTNGSQVLPVLSGFDGFARDLIVTEFVQNTTFTFPEFTHYTPYAFSVTVDEQKNTTGKIPVKGSFYSRIYFDYAPKIDPLSDITVKEDQTYTYDLTPNLTDRDDSMGLLTLEVSRDYIKIDNANHTLLINCTTPFTVDNVTVMVSDGMKSGNRTFSITVTPVNDAPVCVLPIPDQSVSEDQKLEIDLTKYFWDEEDGTRLSFRCSQKNLTIDNTAKKAFWTPKEGSISLYGVVIAASDGLADGLSNPFNLIFIPVYDPPVYLGGLEDAMVNEHENWTVDLDDFFRDEEDSAGLIYESSEPNVTIDRQTHVARWSPSGNADYSIEVVFIAHDAQNYSLTAASPPFELTYIHVNDPPVYLGMLQSARLKPGDEWSYILEDCFRDNDTEILRFSSSNTNVQITELSKTRHKAVWKPTMGSSNITGLVFTVYDGLNYVNSTPINLTFEKMATPDNRPPIELIIRSIPWYVYILLPIGIVGGIAAFYAYRKVKYGKYEIEQLFLVHNDGRLLSHRQKKDTAQISNIILTGMLTALKGFIKESLRDQSQGELDEMKYGNLKIAIEHGKNVYLAAFISGYVTDKLKAEMKDVVKRVEAGFGPVLSAWDGMMDSVEGTGAFLDELIKKEGPGQIGPPPAQ